MRETTIEFNRHHVYSKSDSNYLCLWCIKVTWAKTVQLCFTQLLQLQMQSRSPQRTVVLLEIPVVFASLPETLTTMRFRMATRKVLDRRGRHFQARIYRRHAAECSALQTHTYTHVHVDGDFWLSIASTKLLVNFIYMLIDREAFCMWWSVDGLWDLRWNLFPIIVDSSENKRAQLRADPVHSNPVIVLVIRLENALLCTSSLGD